MALFALLIDSSVRGRGRCGRLRLETRRQGKAPGDKLPFGVAEAWIGSQMTEVARLRGSRVGDEGVGVARTGEKKRASPDA
jgi:hypothetical protein